MEKWAYKYVGLPYREASWGPEYFDCWGLFRHVYKNEFGLDVSPDMSMYTDDQDKVRELGKNIVMWKPVDEPRAGDGILFLIGGKLPHCGIYIGSNKMLHSIRDVSSCIQDIGVPKWKSRFEGFYRHENSS